MLGMSQEQLEQAIHEWFENNQDKVSMFIEGFEAAGADDRMQHHPPRAPVRWAGAPA